MKKGIVLWLSRSYKYVLLDHLRQTIKSIYQQLFSKNDMAVHVTSIFRVLRSSLRAENTFLEAIQDLWLAETLR